MERGRRVVITGLGLVSPFGPGVETYWSNAVAGKSAVRTIDAFDCTNLPVRFGALVKDFDPAHWLDRKLVKNTDRFTHFALVASDMALEDAGLKVGDLGVDLARAGAIVGSGIGGLDELFEQTRRFIERGRVSPFFVPKMIVNAAAGNVAIRHGLRGPNFATASACAAAAHALGTSLLMIRCGMADLMLAGGCEAGTNALGMAGFCAARALSTRNDEPERASRPFDKDRDGFVMGEGGGIFCLEALEHAEARGARIYAELVGYAATDDGHHMTAPEPEGRGATSAMQFALRDAGVNPADVQYVSAHGTSTQLGDIAETLAIKQAFGEHAYRIAVGATKSQVGHLLGAAGVISSVASVLAIDRGVIPPTINLDEPDAACDLDYVPNEAREATVNVALANAFGFGGHNATLVFRRFA